MMRLTRVLSLCLSKLSAAAQRMPSRAGGRAETCRQQTTELLSQTGLQPMSKRHQHYESGTSPQVEDLLEYYMQRAATLQSESERLLAGARDLEESVGVSLSARRFEVPPCTAMHWFSSVETWRRQGIGTTMPARLLSGLLRHLKLRMLCRMCCRHDQHGMKASTWYATWYGRHMVWTYSCAVHGCRSTGWS